MQSRNPKNVVETYARMEGHVAALRELTQAPYAASFGELRRLKEDRRKLYQSYGDDDAVDYTALFVQLEADVIAAAAAADSSDDVNALCSTLLHDSTSLEMLRYKDICARFKKSARTLLLPNPPRKLRYGAVFVSFAGTLRIKCIESLGFDADGYERERAKEEAILDAFHASLKASKLSSSSPSSESSDSSDSD